MTHVREWRSSSLLMVISLSYLLYASSVTSLIGSTRVYPEAPRKAPSPAPANNQENLMKKYFGDGKFPPTNSNVGEGSSDSKRTVPSCPDALHN
ncbi:CLAVATA3/ESR [Hirschfeldia incana]|nr:CLAVATA3/ESR [Hirschfeldia incana]